MERKSERVSARTSHRTPDFFPHSGPLCPWTLLFPAKLIKETTGFLLPSGRGMVKGWLFMKRYLKSQKVPGVRVPVNALQWDISSLNS